MSEVVHSEVTGPGGPGVPLTGSGAPIIQDPETGRLLSPLSWEDRDARECEIARLLAMGFSKTQIAKQVGIPDTSVRDAMRRIRKHWIEKKDEAFENYLAIEIAKIDLVEQEAWGAWLRSVAGGEEEFKRQWKTGVPQGQRKAGRRRKVRDHEAEQLAKAVPEPQPEMDFDSKKPPSGATIIKMLRIKSGIGDPTWLEVILKCSDSRARLLGMNAPARLLVDTGHADINDASRTAVISAISAIVGIQSRIADRLGVDRGAAPIEAAADRVDDAGTDGEPSGDAETGA